MARQYHRNTGIESGLLLTADQLSVYFGIITSGQIVRWDGTKFVGSNS